MYVKQEVRTYQYNRLCDSCGSGKMVFVRFEQDEYEHTCDECGCDRVFAERYPLLKYEGIGDVEYV